MFCGFVWPGNKYKFLIITIIIIKTVIISLFTLSPVSRFFSLQILQNFGLIFWRLQLGLRQIAADYAFKVSNSFQRSICEILYMWMIDEFMEPFPWLLLFTYNTWRTAGIPRLWIRDVNSLLRMFPGHDRRIANIRFDVRSPRGLLPWDSRYAEVRWEVPRGWLRKKNISKLSGRLRISRIDNGSFIDIRLQVCKFNHSVQKAVQMFTTVCTFLQPAEFQGRKQRRLPRVHQPFDW